MKHPQRDMILATIFAPLILVAIALLASSNFGTTGILKAAKMLALPVDTIEVHQQYWYRDISVDYDSVTAICTYGEIFLAQDSEDSTLILFQNVAGVTENEYVGALDSVNSKCRTEAFSLGSLDHITFFRSMSYMYTSPTQLDLGLPDTITWVATLRSQQSDEWLGTLDSVCIMRKDTGMFTFPEFSGTLGEESWDLLSIAAGDFPEALNEDVYISIEMSATGLGDRYFYSDFLSLNAKFSDNNFMPKIPGGASETTANTFTLEAYPNPSSGLIYVDIKATESTSLQLQIFSVDGRQIDVVRPRDLFTGTNRIVYRLPNSAPAGTYFLALVRDDGQVVDNKRVAVVK